MLSPGGGVRDVIGITILGLNKKSEGQLHTEIRDQMRVREAT